MVKRWHLRGAFPPVDFRAVCLVRAIATNVDEDEKCLRWMKLKLLDEVVVES
jgi:hypothetical protein